MEKGPKSPYYDWFMINRWPCREQEGSTRDGRYYSFAFAERMPKLNTSEKKVRDYFLDTVRYWIETFDIDGLRLDVANEISHLFCRELRQMTKQLKPDFYLLGEIWHDAMPWLGGDEFDAVMNYPFAAAIREFWYQPEKTKSDLEEAIHENLVRYMRQTTEVLFNLMDSHDTDRLIHQTGGNQDLFFQQLIGGLNDFRNVFRRDVRIDFFIIEQGFIGFIRQKKPFGGDAFQKVHGIPPILPERQVLCTRSVPSRQGQNFLRSGKLQSFFALLFVLYKK